MSNRPKVESYDQILGEMLAAYQSKIGINDQNTGSAVTSFFEVVALTVARTGGDIFQIVRDLSVDRAEGDALRRIATDEGLTEIAARVASGEVTVTDTSFTKISTKVYAGTKAPNVGSTSLPVSDASLFPASGSVYIGRGTPNIEGPIAYSSKTQLGGYWVLNLSSPTTKFHNINESVVLAQGGTRNIPVGTVVKSPASGASPDINFTVTQAAVILDGETEVAGVKVSAQEPGAQGNVPISGIREFGSTPFPGATVSNPLPFKTGRDIETDEELRVRIKRARLSRGLGTALAVKNAVIGATPPDEPTTVVASEIATDADKTVLYVDDNTGYEEKTAGVGIELIVDSALGGETNFKLETGGKQTSIAKAFLLSNNSAPFAVSSNDRLAVSVGGIVTEHIFQSGDFLSDGGATAYEIVSSINANPDLNFQATTSEGGTKVVLSAKADENEAIQITDVSFGNNAATAMGFPSNEVQTLRLFKNKQPLSKDGNPARILSERQVNWSPSIANGDTIILSVDGTDFITYQILDADFIAQGDHPSVAASNSLESWVEVLNNKLTGVTASIVGEQISLVSNLGNSNRARVEIDPSSTLVSKGLFSSALGLISQGKQADFKLSLNTAEFKLNEALAPGDELTAGTPETEARVQTARVLGGIVTLSSEANLWLLQDDQDAEIVNTGLVTNTLVAVSKPATDIVRFSTVTPNTFSTLQVGDYIINWSEEFSAANRLEGRVHAVTSSSVDIKVTAAEFAAAVVENNVLYQEGFAVVRTSKVPQRFKVTSGTKSLSQIANELNLQASGAEFSVLDDEILFFKTLTKSATGAVLVVTFNDSAKVLGFTQGASDTSKDSLIAYYESSYKEGDIPLFFHAAFASGAASSPPDSYVATVSSDLNLTTFGLDPNIIISQLQPYGNILDTLSPNQPTMTDSVSGTSITLSDDRFIKRIRPDDRYFAAQPLDLAHNDELVVILDGDATNKTFQIPLYRKAVTNTTAPNSATSFSAYDTDGGPTNSFTNFFGSNFSFDNYKVLMRAKNVLDHGLAEDAILFRSKQWGRSGEKVNVGYTYPTAANNPISHTVVVDKDVNVRISLKSGPDVVTTIDGTTEWNVTVTSNVPVAGVDQVTYTWSGTGTAPGMGALVGGEYVNITRESEFSKENTGIFRLSTEAGFLPSANSFSVVRESGSAVPESDKATLVSSSISFFEQDPTTAAEIVSYVNANATLSQFVEASLVDDSGTSGAGVISVSTEQFSNFVYSSVYLEDGINWIASTNLSGNPQFFFKRPLDLPSATGYAFNQSEEIRLVPTTAKQVSQLLNVLAVTGLTTLGSIGVTQRDGRLEISTDLLGGQGSVQVVGGLGNASETPILGNSSLVETQYVKSRISAADLQGIKSDQLVKLEALNRQAKSTLFKTQTSFEIIGNSPSVGQSTVKALNKTISDRFFGKPRNHVRTLNRSFKVEKQGSFVCISWDGTGTQPGFSKALNFNDALGGTLNIERLPGSSECQLTVVTSGTNFAELSLGDILVIQNRPVAENNGSFLVTGVSEDGKSIRYLNPVGVSEFSLATFVITDNTNINADTFTVNGTPLVAGTDFLVGVDATETAVNLAAAISSLPLVSATSAGAVVTVVADNALAFYTVSYTPSGPVAATVSGPALEGPAFASGDFSSTTEIAEGDNVLIGEPFNVLNQGKYRVVRRFNNSIYIENSNAVEETVLMPLDVVSVGLDGTTGLDIDASDSSLKISWDGTGTEPNFENAQVGDELTLGTDFDPNNQGTFMVTKAEPKLTEISSIQCAPASEMVSGQYFVIYTANDAQGYYVWYNIAGAGGDPMPMGLLPIEVAVGAADNAAAVASATSAAIALTSGFVTSVSSAIVTVETNGFGPTTDTANFNITGSFQVTTTQQGQNTTLVAVNPLAVSESGILVSDVFQIHRPGMLFYEYDATVPGDRLYITSDIFGLSNVGNYLVEKAVDDSTIVVSGTLASVGPVNIAGNETTIYVEEQTPYVGYKFIRLVSVDPSNITSGNIVFSTRYQFDKINEDASVQVSAVGKLGFDTTIKKGLDSYRYHTGLIGECNRVVYGDPTDSATYPGVGAAGAEIFIKAPFVRRVSVAVDVRLETGIPFAAIAEQVRTNISALVIGNPIGESIAISDIVSAVNSIPGVRAVAISSPLYNSSNDTIKINPGEKARILDAIQDISVSQIG